VEVKLLGVVIFELSKFGAELTHKPLLQFLTSVTELVDIYGASCLQKPRVRK
jgi:hypothetical protein